jgi:hypothetical protein
LDPVVPHRAGGIQTFLDIAGLENLARSISPIGPNTGQAIGL